ERELKTVAVKQTAAKQREESKQQAAQVRKASNLVKKHERTVAQMEDQIQQLEALLGKLADDLQTAGASGTADKVQRLSKEYASQQYQLEKLVAEWERAVTA
ncbi:MAG TPA: hypothetical protein VGK87_01255, partial [Anaerolineae bacterium]